MDISQLTAYTNRVINGGEITRDEAKELSTTKIRLYYWLWPIKSAVFSAAMMSTAVPSSAVVQADVPKIAASAPNPVITIQA